VDVGGLDADGWMQRQSGHSLVWIKFFVGITCTIVPLPALCPCEFMVKGLVQ